MKTRVTELLGIEYPIIQGGMAWVATHELASAVSNAGGLGIIGAGGAPASWVREQIQAAKKETGKTIGIMHSLPRFAGEFDFAIDQTPHELYFKQIGFSIPLRMALICAMVVID